MNTININRVGSLLNYDWMLHKRTLTLAAILIPLIYVIIAFMAFVTNSEFTLSNPSDKLPGIMTLACKSYFGFAQWATIIVVTTLLTEKFCYPRTATSYLPLPGTSLEKVITMFAEYVIAFGVVCGIYAAMHYMTMGIGYLYAPELDWGINVFNPMSNITMFNGNLDNLSVQLQQDGVAVDVSDAFADTITSFVRASIWLSPFVAIAEVTFYMVLNMFFKTNVQIKAIACCVILYVAFVVGCLITFGAAMVSMSPDMSVDAILPFYTNFMTGLRYAMYASPLIAFGLMYAFYRQVCAKQAK